MAQLELTRFAIADERERALLRLLCSGVECESESKVTRRTRIGQLMYTPDDIKIAEPQPNQRPWAGLLYIERAYEVPKGPDRTITFTGRIGITGPNAYAEQAQAWVHKHITDSPKPMGWDNQIGTSLGILAGVKDERGLGSEYIGKTGWGIRGAWYWQAVAGNIMTYAALGTSFVFGRGEQLTLPPFGEITPKEMRQPTPFQPVQQLQQVVPVAYGAPDLVEVTVFGNVEARAVAFNVFLDGRPGRHDPDIDRRVLVADASLGMQLTFPRWRGWFVKFKMTERSRELNRKSGVGSQRWGALTFGQAF